jgi:hypothetical protein
MPAPDTPAIERRSPVPALFAAVISPILIFYSYLFYTSRNIPLTDDYDAGLKFANRLVQIHGFSERLIYFIGAQHNEYKILVGHGLVWLQLALTGHINFAVLSALGNVSVLFLGIILWKMFLPDVNLERRLALFLPVSLILFQYQYVETLNWPLPGVATLPVVTCAIGSIYLLGRRTRGTFVSGLALMMLGIAALGNGFLIVPVGMLMLVIGRMYARLAAWTLAAALCALMYAYHYKAVATQSPTHHSLLVVLMHPQFVYLLGFLGSAGRFPVRPGAVVLGTALFVFFGWMIRRGYLKQEPVVGYCLLFLLLTGIGVSGIRSDLGLAQSVASRYRIYSDLLLIFAWFAFVKTSRMDETPVLRRNRLFVTAVVISALFCIAMDGIGARNLHKRDQKLEEGMAHFERSGGLQSPVYSPDGEIEGYPGFDEHARQILIESEKLGIYEPKPY